MAVLDGKLAQKEMSVLSSVAESLDVSPPFVSALLERWRPREERGAGEGGLDRSRCLAALELPRDAILDRPAIERAGRRIQDLYAEEKFSLLAPELREIAAKRREVAADAALELLRELPEAPPRAEAPLTPGVVRRENPDLDSIFSA